MDNRSERAYLGRIADAVSTLAEMAMTGHHGLRHRRYVAYYDDNDEEWVVALQWRDEDGDLREDEIVRGDQFPTALEHAYEIFLAAHR